jgi:hypothetical protein
MTLQRISEHPYTSRMPFEWETFYDLSVTWTMPTRITEHSTSDAGSREGRSWHAPRAPKTKLRRHQLRSTMLVD